MFKVELSPIGLYRLEFEYGHSDWKRLHLDPQTWNRAFELYNRRLHAVSKNGLPQFVTHRIVPVYDDED